MESSTSKAEIMKPLLFKAGIPLTLSLAAFICGKIWARISIPKDNISETKTQFDSDHESYESLSKTNLEAEILGLRCRIEELQKREWEVETQFIRYVDLKEQESMLTRISDAMSLEIAHVEFFNKEISLMVDEIHRVDDLVIGYLKALEQLDYSKSERGLLQNKVKKLSRRIKLQSSLVRERDLKIREKEEELLRTQEMLETTSDVVKKLETEVSEMRLALARLLEEKNELSNKLDLEKRFASSLSKNEAEMISIEEQTQLEYELEQLKKDRATEIKELINLRWTNACLRHKLSKIQEQQDQKRDDSEINFQGKVEIETYELEQEFAGLVENSFKTEKGNEGCSKRKKLIKRLRKWVEGCDKGKGKVGEERERHEVKCFKSHSVSYEQKEHLQGRLSCSSA